MEVTTITRLIIFLIILCILSVIAFVLTYIWNKICIAIKKDNLQFEEEKKKFKNTKDKGKIHE